MSMQLHQLNLSIPESLYQELKRLVPAGKRTRFLIHLTRLGLKQLRLKKALAKTYGVWAERGHPELRRGVGPYIRSLRRGRKLPSPL